MPRMRDAIRSGWNHSSCVELLADRRELDRLAGDRLHGERSAAARVAVELRHDDAVEVDALLERLRDVDGLLAGHRVEHEQHVRRLRLAADRGELLHQRLVDLQAAGGVEDHDVAAVGLRALDPVADRLHRVGCARRRRRERRPARRAGSAARSRPGAGGRRRRAPAACRPSASSSASLPAVVVLPEPWRPASRIVVGGRGENASFDEPEPISSVSSSWTIFTTCWPGRQALLDVLAERALADLRDELLDDVEVDVGLEQREAHLAHRAGDRLLVERTPRPRRSPRALWSLSERVSNIERVSVAGGPDFAHFRSAVGATLWTWPLPSPPRGRPSPSLLRPRRIDRARRALDPESLRGLLGRWYEAMRAAGRAARRHRREVHRRRRDGGLRRAARARGRRAARGPRRGRDARRARRLNDELAAERRPSSQIRIGINTGEVVTGDGTTTLVTGDAVNTAKRLEEAAPPARS